MVEQAAARVEMPSLVSDEGLENKPCSRDVVDLDAKTSCSLAASASCTLRPINVFPKPCDKISGPGGCRGVKTR